MMDDDFQVEKNVFVVFYSGERAKNKILKICDAFGANRYPFTDDIGKQYQIITEVWNKTIFFPNKCAYYLFGHV